LQGQATGLARLPLVLAVLTVQLTHLLVEFAGHAMTLVVLSAVVTHLAVNFSMLAADFPHLSGDFSALTG